ncbi:unnamed protein product [Rhizophagus irregularis]|nr:unnamed protein product [Rhizophagus irregularis]
MRNNDPLWFIESFTENNFLSHIFWMNPKQINLWMKFSDVVVCDTTFSTNRYNMSLMLFIGIDKQNRSQLLGQALTRDEREKSFNWIMSCMKKATSNTIPRIIFTDVDATLHNAIKVQFSDSQLASCIFHIKQNLKKNVRPKLQSDYANFIVEFDKIYDYTAVLNNLEESSIDVKECNLESLLEDIDESSILELWQVKYAVLGSKSCNFIAILKDGSHLCTCLYIISRRLVCRHFFRVLRASNNAKFNIVLIANRWYKDDISDNVKIDHNSSMCSFNLSKRKRYGKIYGLACRVMQLAVDNNDQEPT